MDWLDSLKAMCKRSFTEINPAAKLDLMDNGLKPNFHDWLHSEIVNINMLLNIYKFCNVLHV